MKVGQVLFWTGHTGTLVLKVRILKVTKATVTFELGSVNGYPNQQIKVLRNTVAAGFYTSKLEACDSVIAKLNIEHSEAISALNKIDADIRLELQRRAAIREGDRSNDLTW